MTDPGTADKEGERIQSIDQLAERQERVESKLDALIGSVDKLLGGGKPDPKATSGSDSASSSSASASGGSVEEQVQAELARRDKAAADEADKQDRESLKAQVAKLSEKPPRPPARRATKLLGWGDGRG